MERWTSQAWRGGHPKHGEVDIPSMERWTSQAWSEGKPEMISNCFRSSGTPGVGVSSLKNNIFLKILVQNWTRCAHNGHTGSCPLNECVNGMYVLSL